MHLIYQCPSWSWRLCPGRMFTLTRRISILLSVLGKITFKMISNQNQNHTRWKVISNQNQNHWHESDLKSKSLFEWQNQNQNHKQYQISANLFRLLHSVTQLRINYVFNVSCRQSHCYLSVCQPLVLSINSFSNIASESLFLRGDKINPPILNSLSTGAEEGRVVLYFRNVALTFL